MAFHALTQTRRQRGLFFGDLNAYTLSAAGWDDAESLVNSAYVHGRRLSECAGQSNERGRDLLHLAQLNEMRFANGIIVPWLRADATVTRVGAELGGESGTVLDYVVASDQVLRAIRSLKIEDTLHAAWSDHRPVRFRWQGRPVKEDELTPDAPSERGPVGWRFEGNPSAEQKKDAMTYFASDLRLSSVCSTIENASP